MQPQEPPTGQAPPSPAGPVAVPPPALLPPTKPARKRSRVRLWVALGGGILALLCLGGAGIFLSVYDKATKIQRSSPTAVVDSFLRAFLVDRDDSEASLYECKAGGDFSALTALRTEMVEREKKVSGDSVSASWGSLSARDVDKTHTSVATTLNISGSVNGNVISRRYEQWTFGLVDDGGWRACTATKVG